MTPAPKMKKPRPPRKPDLALVGAELPKEYAHKMRELHLWTGRMKKEVLMEAIDCLHSQYQPKPQGGPQP